MCLAAVYVDKGETQPKELVLDKVQTVEVNEGTLTCTNLFGQVAEVHGAIKRVDLANSVVIIAQ